MKFLVITNHSYMLWQFRRELIAALQERGEVVLSMPFVGHEKDFMAMGCRCIETPFERRSINPVTDGKLLLTYRRILREEKPDLVITYSIKPNVYAGFLCEQMHIPYCVNVQGLGTAFQKEPIATLVTQMYRVALKRAKAVFFENEGNAREFVERGILPADKPTVLHGAGVNTDAYAQQPYPSEDQGIRFLYLGRIMREKGIDECFSAAEELKRKYGDRVQFELVGFFGEGGTPGVRWCDDIPRIPVRSPALLCGGPLCCSAQLPRGNEQRSAGGCRHGTGPDHHGHSRLPGGGGGWCYRLSLPENGR